MDTLEQFKDRLKEQSKYALINIVREQANTLVKEGNPFFAALIRELADRYEESYGPSTHLRR